MGVYKYRSAVVVENKLDAMNGIIPGYALDLEGSAMTLGQNFPIGEYYRANILDARTLSNRAGWWTAVLLIEDQRTKKPFLSIYRWQYTDRGWKVRNLVHIRRKVDANLLIEAIETFAERLE